jgi:ketosteroid isomerase-like protein
MTDDLINRLDGDLGVRRTLARLADSIFRRDPETHGECYAEDGEWHAFGVITRGRQAIVDHWWTIMQGFPFARQMVSALIIEVDGDTAAARAQLDEIVGMPDGTYQTVMGIYHSTFRKHGTEWLLRVHRYDQLYFGPPSLDGKFFPVLDYGRPPHDPDPSRMTRPMDISL